MTLVARLAVLTSFAVLLGAAQANAAIIIYTVPLNGFNEVDGGGNPGQGDLDGTGTSIFTVDTATNSISWNTTVLNIALPVTGHHIHIGGPTQNGGIVIDFGSALVGGPIIDADVAALVANPAGFYSNVHNGAFPGGAIRGQVPEPTTLALLGVGLVGLAAASRRRSH